MSAKPRCRECKHRPGVRRVTETRKTEGNPASLAQPRVHKKPCACACHPAVTGDA